MLYLESRKSANKTCFSVDMWCGGNRGLPLKMYFGECQALQPQSVCCISRGAICCRTVIVAACCDLGSCEGGAHKKGEERAQVLHISLRQWGDGGQRGVSKLRSSVFAAEGSGTPQNGRPPSMGRSFPQLSRHWQRTDEDILICAHFVGPHL